MDPFLQDEDYGNLEDEVNDPALLQSAPHASYDILSTEGIDGDGAPPRHQGQEQQQHAAKSVSFDLDSVFMSEFPADSKSKARAYGSSKENDTTNDSEESGIYTLPPAGRESFLLRGDNGIVRWVTAAALDRQKKKTTANYQFLYDNNNININDDDDDDGAASPLQPLVGRGGLLAGGATIAQLREELANEERENERAAAAANNLEAAAHRRAEETRREQQQKQQQQEGADSGALWVDRYSPSSFREILSDESINLQLLQWLKSWEPYVFPSRHSGSGAPPAAEPPEERLALLAGPPGVGKTTLAHVLGAHCGYEVIEINASVERTTSRAESLIRMAVTPVGSAGPAPMADGAAASSSSSGGGGVSLLDRLRRPKLLVMDEVDGLATQTTQFLLAQDIRRPVLCLCNDAYAPSLRALRQRVSQVYRLPPIQPQRLLARLEEIAAREGVAVGTAALADLVQLSNGDVRSCLNTLQFLKGLPGLTAATAAEAIRASQGKDTHADVWQCWRLVLHRPERSRSIRQLRSECGVDYDGLLAESRAYAQSVAELRRRRERAGVIDRASLHSAAAPSPAPGTGTGTVVPGFRVAPGYLYASHMLPRCAEGSVLLEGLWEHYLSQPLTDYSLARTAGAAAALARQDVLTTEAFSRTQGLVGFAERHTVQTALAVHALCATTAARSERLTFPRAGQQLRQAQAEAAHTAATFREGVRALHCALHVLNAESCATDWAPFLLRSLVPADVKFPTHPVNAIAALPAAERRALEASVQRHALYGLSYRHDAAAAREAREREEASALQRSTNNNSGVGGFGAIAALRRARHEWVLAPDLEAIAGFTRPFTNPSSSSGSGYPSFRPYPRGPYQAHGSGVSGGGGVGGGGVGAGLAAKAEAETPSVPVSPLRRVGDEIRQLLVAAIQQYDITRAAAAHRRRPRGAEGEEKEGAEAEGSAAPAAKRGRKEGEEEAKEASAAAPPPVAVPEGKAAGKAVKKDFFGRPIISPGAVVGKSSSARRAGHPHGVGGGATRKPAIKYVYHDGATNAVKMPASFTDF